MDIPRCLIESLSLNPPKKRTLEARDHVLTSEDFQQTAKEILSLVVVLMVSGKTEIASLILEKLFRVPSFFAAKEEQLTLEILWNSFSGRPSNEPWDKWDKAKLAEGIHQVDPGSLEFCKTWTKTDWIQDALKITIGPDYDSHQWKDSKDPWTHAISARVLCQPKDRNLPSREKLQEAFEVIDKLFSHIPLSAPNYLPHYQIFPVHVYFLLGDEFDIRNFLSLPILYKTSEDAPTPTLNEAEIEEMGQMLCAALDTRIKQGWKPPLHDVPMAEVLRRFSEAAFSIHKDEYLQNSIKTPKDILSPALTSEEVAKIEETLGPLPADVKEIALIADGFHGGWHFAGGGWPGIQGLYKASPADYETYLGYEPPEEQRIETKTRDDGTLYQVTINVRSYGLGDSLTKTWGDIYAGPAKTECDDFEHVLCPANIWKKVQASKGVQVKEDEYAYFHYAHWTAGPDEIGNVTNWIASMTLGLERDVALGLRSKSSVGNSFEM